MKEDQFIAIVSDVPPRTNYAGDSESSAGLLFRGHTTPTQLGDALKHFTELVSRSLGSIRDVGEDFQVDEVELSAIMGVDGKLQLLGSGLSSKAEGSIKIVFRRKQKGSRHSP